MGSIALEDISGGQYSLEKETEQDGGWHLEGMELDDMKNDSLDSALITVEPSKGDV